MVNAEEIKNRYGKYSGEDGEPDFNGLNIRWVDIPVSHVMSQEFREKENFKKIVSATLYNLLDKEQMDNIIPTGSRARFQVAYETYKEYSQKIVGRIKEIASQFELTDDSGKIPSTILENSYRANVGYKPKEWGSDIYK
ncbi:MAG: hypothetical protein ABEK36_02965 [Candidatus Aenigmatarchaeota archaeon]